MPDQGIRGIGLKGFGFRVNISHESRGIYCSDIT